MPVGASLNVLTAQKNIAPTKEKLNNWIDCMYIAHHEDSWSSYRLLMYEVF